MGDQIKKDTMGKSCGIYGEKRNTNKVLVYNPERKGNLEEPGIDGTTFKWAL
jgi:hypothetical protein